jgi:S-methylmethionine-dependent homocysteine/selenocysteine methylase
MRYETIRRKLAAGQTIILDGGTGTDIQRRGAPMSGDTWCADVNLTHGNIVKDVHLDYIAQGADIITANTYATSPLTFSHIGRVADVNKIDAVAVAIAKEAALGTDVCVAGSMSTMRPMQAGTDRNNLSIEWSKNELRALFAMKAKGLKDSGVDLIMMEMMRDADYAVLACEAAIATGLPVWIGIAVEKRDDGALTGFGRGDQLLKDIAPALAALKPDVMSIMHSSPEDTGPAIDLLKKSWSGPMGTYPESGYFKSPDWLFTEIAPSDLVAAAKIWQQQGVTIFGGCCGIGPAHIKALHEAFTA